MNTSPLFIECKNAKLLNLREAMRQAQEQTPRAGFPAVVDGRGRANWDNPSERPTITMFLTDFVDLLEQAAQGWLVEGK